MRDQVQRTYKARIENIDSVYDGDTINKVFFRLPIDVRADQEDLGEIFPEIYVHDIGVWVLVNVRLDGIDTPERHPHHRYPDGRQRTPEDIEKERMLAMEARTIVQNLLMVNNMQFEIRNPQVGKYAGRIVAEVWVRDPEHKQMINVSKRLITKGLAYPYEGGTKKIWGKES